MSIAGPAAAPLLEVRGLCMRFPGVRALHRVDLALGAGEVLAVIGENGAGKSTLMEILAGIQQADAGDVCIDGRAVQIKSAGQAMAHGIALIHQELDLADNLDVAANIFLGREPQRCGFVDRAREERAARRVLDLVGAEFSPRVLVASLSLGEQQLVEVAKALSLEARILIMDEPTSSLTQPEAARLMAVVRDLTERGVSVIYISHRLGEVVQLADRVMVLRDGENSGELRAEQIEHDAMVRMMVGRDLATAPTRVSHARQAIALEVEDLVLASHPRHPLSLAVHEGEIVGLAGLVGAGRTELLCALFGIDTPLGGAVRVGGRAVARRGARSAIRAGIALVPEDRKSQGLFLEMAVRENISIASLSRHHRLGFVDRYFEAGLLRDMIELLGIDTPSAEQTAQCLSGGNQQKVVLARWLALQPRVLLLDEPTRGIDVGARLGIYALMEQLAERGVAVLFASSEMEEVLRMSDRVLVMFEGRITGELDTGQFGEEAIMQLATGAARATR